MVRSTEILLASLGHVYGLSVSTVGSVICYPKWEILFYTEPCFRVFFFFYLLSFSIVTL